MKLPKPRNIEVERYVGGLSELKNIDNPIKLSANESALGPSPKAIEAFKKDNDKLDLIPSDQKKLSGSFISLGKSDQVTGALLNAKAGDLIGPVKTFRGYGIIQVKNISSFDSTAWNIQKDLIRLDLVRQKQNRIYQSWMTDLIDNANIVDNRKYYF